MSVLNIWEKAQGSIKETIGESSYETWFSQLRASEKDPATILIETPDEFFRNWIVEHYLKTIEEKLATASDQSIAVEFSINTSPQKDTAAPRLIKNDTAQHSSIDERRDDININPRFSFDNFVIGPSNRFAYAAATAVAESPAKAYNPLFIYGQVGLGKTHLMQAITQQIRKTDPSLSICYISSEKFTNELIDAIRHRSTPNFRQKYRNIDVLLIDDIQFIAGKESTQEEFFHTFNALHNNRKQIIISSDRPPKEISNLEERLSSRFAWGLITDIQPPTYETRVAILKKKIEREPVEVPDNVIFFIAEQIKTNIRELEGALIRVVAYSLLEEKPISLEMAKVILKDMVKETVKIISVEMIQKEVADYYNISVTELKAKKRNKNILQPRQVAMYLSRQLTKLSLPEIGQAFGGKDHTTVLHSCKKMAQDVSDDRDLKSVMEKLTAHLKQ
ncbi:MAG: chromosomal replication initiator protein DnaA [Candidatus Omnitrophica bacterium]|nr:chromosomal replication initiator protein DnaA [Candidatus Omnitrophota bacterium]